MRTLSVPSDLQRAAEASIERELNSVRAAVELVATGLASRVSLGGLRMSSMLGGEARRIAARRGVRITEIWPLGDGNPDLVVESVDVDGSVRRDA